MNIGNQFSRLMKQAVVSWFNLLPATLIKKILGVLSVNYALQDKWQFYIRPVHYYEPLPDFSTITKEQILRRRIPSSIDWQLKSMLELVEKLSKYRGEFENYDFQGQFYGLDAASYYALLRYLKPSKVIEIGAGTSTQIASVALAQNQLEGKMGKIICIEPYPQPMLTDGSLDIELITDKLENIDISLFSGLDADDVLFIDSSHTVKFNSDVCKEFLEILPLLSRGVYIHIHDIFIPYDYPERFLLEWRFAWNEQYMLEAFLAYNSDFEVILANHWLSVDYPEKMAEIWPEVLSWPTPYHNCSSFWIYKK